MTRKAWLVAGLVAFAAIAAAQQPSQPAFDKNKAPALDLPTYAPPETPANDDDAAEKIRQVQAQMDTAAGQPQARRTDAAKEPSMGRDTLRTFAYLCLVLALIVALGYVVRRVGKRVPLLAGADLGQLAGKVYLSPRVCLHYVRTGGKMLIVGVTPNTMSLIAEFDETLFPSAPASNEPRTESAASEPVRAESFLAELQASLHAQEKPEPAQAPSEEAELDALRKDVLRLQQYLEGRTRGPSE
ncbi:MAG: flagellar biosynthetic protein FliO [Candidatus Hydrogenedentes bacterium]|nr:flagellar biosynthetic protein FliO [Candidatus Hydrogenedentota bacterium]